MIPEPGNTDLNFVDFIILLGVVQGIMLFITSLFRKGRKEKFKAAMYFLLTCIIAEIFLNRTGYMYFVIPLVDFSEPFQFALPPLIYLLVLSIDPRCCNQKMGTPFCSVHCLYPVFSSVLPGAIRIQVRKLLLCAPHG